MALRVPAASGSALLYNGTGINSTSFTLLALVKRHTDRNANGVIFLVGTSDASPGYTSDNHIHGLQLGDDGDTLLGMVDWATSSTNIGAISPSAWELLFLRGEVSGAQNIVTIGRVSSAGAVTKQSATTSLSWGNAHFRVGNGWPTAFDRPAAIDIAHLKLWSRALTDGEIIAEATSAVPASATGLINYTSFINKQSVADALGKEAGSGSGWTAIGNGLTLNDSANPTVAGGRVAVFAFRSTPAGSNEDVRQMTNITLQVQELGTLPKLFGPEVFTTTTATISPALDAQGRAVIRAAVPSSIPISAGQGVKALLLGTLAGAPHAGWLTGTIQDA